MQNFLNAFGGEEKLPGQCFYRDAGFVQPADFLIPFSGGFFAVGLFSPGVSFPLFARNIDGFPIDIFLNSAQQFLGQNMLCLFVTHAVPPVRTFQRFGQGPAGLSVVIGQIPAYTDSTVVRDIQHSSFFVRTIGNGDLFGVNEKARRGTLPFRTEIPCGLYGQNHGEKEKGEPPFSPG